MKFSTFSKVTTAAALALGTQAALAIDQTTYGGAAGENGSLIVTVFDQVKGNSLVQVLTSASYTEGRINYQEFTEALATPDAGLTLNFNVDLSFFTANGSNFSDLKYTVFAGDASGLAPQTGVMFTAEAGLDPTSFAMPNGDITGMLTVAGSLTQVAPNPDQLLLTGTNFGATGTYTGGGNWGDQFGSYLDVLGSASLNTALGFYQASKSSTTAGAQANKVRYENANGYATWYLGDNGTLTYSIAGVGSEVPLPAAVWLMLSGIGGLGVFGRRRAAA